MLLTSFDIQVISCKQVSHKWKYGIPLKQSDWLVLVIGLDWTNLVIQKLNLLNLHEADLKKISHLQYGLIEKDGNSPQKYIYQTNVIFHNQNHLFRINLNAKFKT